MEHHGDESSNLGSDDQNKIRAPRKPGAVLRAGTFISESLRTILRWRYHHFPSLYNGGTEGLGICPQLSQGWRWDLTPDKTDSIASTFCCYPGVASCSREPWPGHGGVVCGCEGGRSGGRVLWGRSPVLQSPTSCA